MFPYLRVHPSRLLVAAMAVVVLTGCEIPGIWPDPRIAQREEESKAMGGACIPRQAQDQLWGELGIRRPIDGATLSGALGSRLRDPIWPPLEAGALF